MTPVRVLITVALLGLVLVSSSLSSLPEEIGRANVPLLVAMLGCSYIAWIVNTYRWQRILAGFRVTFGFAELFRLNLSGVFYGLALPGQVSGEIVKALRLGGRTGQRRIIYLSIFLDRVYGLIGLALLGCLALVLEPPRPDWFGRSPGIVALGLVSFAGILIVTLPWLCRVPGLLRSGGNQTIGKLEARLLSLTAADGCVPPVATLVVGCSLGLMAQALTAVIHWGVALALGLTVSPLALTWILALGTILGMFPLSFAGLGVREATYVGLLSLFGVSAGAALTLSLTMFAILVALGVTGGALDLLVRDPHPSSDGRTDGVS
jgi:uncharacterized membrane protein YbhN (UPF0104 family)